MADTEQTDKPGKKDRTTPKKKRTARKIAGFVVLGALVVVLGAGAWAAKTGIEMYRQTDLSKLAQEPPMPLRIYDVNKELITELTNSRMEYVPYSAFPKALTDAIVAVEDSRFYEHDGIDYKGLSRALFTNVKNGEVVQGGSTITQQLAKVKLFSSEQTFERKINEAVAALKIENNYGKEQILELYLNYIYYGRGAWGIERASQIYFGKKTQELTLPEAALLAGLPKSPNAYSPLNNPDKAKERRDLVLGMMASQGKITAEQRDLAQNEPIKLTENTSLSASNKYPTYVDYVIQETLDKTKMSEQEILSAGLEIYTNLDPKVQDAAEAVYRDKKNFPGDKGGLQSSVVVLDAKTGAVKGLVGSRSETKEFRAFNYATQLQRQPGSTIKPVVVYTPALLAGFKPGDLINDVETEFAGGYKPNNYGHRFHGWVTMEEALAQSYNVPAVAMMKEVGIEKALAFGRKAGLPLEDDDRVYGLALGGMKYGTSPLVMAQAYTMYANGGSLAHAYAVTQVKDRNGNVILEQKTKTERVIDADTAYTMSEMLQKVITEGSGRNARLNRDVAGKTGTTQLPDVAEFRTSSGGVIDGSKDAWFVGYTPELVTAVWVGYPVTNREHYLTTGGDKLPAAIFQKIMSQALKGQPVTAFKAPRGYRLAGGKIQRINGESGKAYAAVDSGERRSGSRTRTEDSTAGEPPVTPPPSPSPSQTPADGTITAPGGEATPAAGTGSPPPKDGTGSVKPPVAGKEPPEGTEKPSGETTPPPSPGVKPPKGETAPTASAQPTAKPPAPTKQEEGGAARSGVSASRQSPVPSSSPAGEEAAVGN